MKLSDVITNVFAGLTVGIIALPLSMALAIATGVAPQHGLYTAIVAGIVCSLAGGSRVNISGPTAAFVVILLPIVNAYGLGGLLVSGMMAGVILVAMGMGRMGRFISMVPYPVIIGFTSGIGVVIATIQVKDFFGLTVEGNPEHYLDRLSAIINAFPSAQLDELFIAVLTFLILVIWPKFRRKVPPHLVALLVATTVAWLLQNYSADFEIATIGSRFQYDIDGAMGNGIPPIPLQFQWPWELPDAAGAPIGLSYDLIRLLLPAAFSIAILGALESLLCATVADGMSGTKHDPNKELIGQGLANIVTPFFGGIPATAAIARTAANIKAGGTNAVSPIVHSLTILVAMLALSDLIAFIPMAAMAALLIKVAWNMSEAKHFIRIVKVAPSSDVMTLLVCFFLTVIFDMEIAVATGIGLAGLLFIRRSIDLMDGKLVDADEHPHAKGLPDSVLIYGISGPMFFGAAQKALAILTNLNKRVDTVILDMANVTMLDMTAIVALETIIEDLNKKGIDVIISGLAPKMIAKLDKAGVKKKAGLLEYSDTMIASTAFVLAELKGKSLAH
ncbi:MAG: C4-dicarboxylic acid transporter DauA [Piscirickettsiaceae bacterium]|nr:MAG: C4-dicarboxylic acid transporter DauA [Piscirickettsiaceae bacterium]